jgi:acetyl esterase/lipase
MQKRLPAEFTFKNRQMRRFFFYLALLHCVFQHAAAQQKEPAVLQELAAGRQEFLLWPVSEATAGAAGQEKVRIPESGDHVVSNIQLPSITYFPAEKGETAEKGKVRKMRTSQEMRKANDRVSGMAVIIAPGGGHAELWIDHEGYRPAQWLSQHGVAAFVLKYRLAKEPGSHYTVDVEALADMQRAIRFVRSHAAAWGIDTARVGVMGFSAGGELAALAAMRYDSVQLPVHDSVDNYSSRPDFQALIYPGNSGRYTVTKHSPPVFILCGYQDREDISAGMARLYLKYKEMGIPAELHIYSNIGHGFGLRETNKGGYSEWPQLLLDWMVQLPRLGGDEEYRGQRGIPR